MVVGKGGLVDLAQSTSAWLFHSRDNLRKANERRRFAIHAYTGANGGGKSLAAVHDTIPSLREGRPVLSTVRILDFDNPRDCDGLDCDDPNNHEVLGVVHGQAHPLYRPLRNYAELTAFTAGDVILDEVTGIASSRESHAMPVQVVNYLMQLRRRDVLLRWTAPNWARADKVIREVTQAVTDCAGAMPVSSGRADGTTRLWRDRRLFAWSTFDAFAFDEFSAHKRDNLRPLVRQHFWRPGSTAGSAYDTRDAVLALGWANDAGMCMSCGGKRSVPRCECAAGPERGTERGPLDGTESLEGARSPRRTARTPRAHASPPLALLPPVPSLVLDGWPVGEPAG